MTRYDPHPQAHDDARTTPHGFTSGPSAAQNGSGVLGDADAAAGLREALEALAAEWETYLPQPADDMRSEGWRVAVKNRLADLRAVLAAHPADAPAEASEPSGDVVERAARLAHSTLLNHHHGSSCNSPAPEHRWDAVSTGRAIARALADAGLLADRAETERRENVSKAWAERWLSERDRARDLAADLEAENWDLVKERDRAIVEQRPLVDSLIEARRQRYAAEGERDRARARVAALEAEVERLRVTLGNGQTAVDWFESELESVRGERDWFESALESVRGERNESEARARRAEDALREVRDNTKNSAMQRAIIDRALSTTGQTSEHDCSTCTDCLHDGQRCCGCYDGACCQTSDATPSDTTTEEQA